ncbi:MAG: hypothetical protein WBF03_17115 [Xanthobacteraceae bacterium]
MRKLTIPLAAAALALGAMALSASAQNQQPGAASLHAQAQKATPIHQAACRGFGRHCLPGSRWVCGPAHCWCAPC